jgi:hypothetical protein
MARLMAAKDERLEKKSIVAPALQWPSSSRVVEAIGIGRKSPE